MYKDGSSLVYRWVVQVSYFALASVFGTAIQGIVDINGCDSVLLNTSFPGAESFFGNNLEVSSDTGSTNEKLLFQDLAGQNGFSHRSTTTASSFVAPFQLAPAPNNKPVTLAPAVVTDTTTPALDGAIRSGTSYAVNFDTDMDQSKADQALTITGCQAKVTASWASSTQLKYSVTFPSSTPGGKAMLTVHNADALAATAGFANELDGNQSGGSPNLNGEAPNRNDYSWTVYCNTATATIQGAWHDTYEPYCGGICYTQVSDFNWTAKETLEGPGPNVRVTPVSFSITGSISSSTTQSDPSPAWTCKGTFSPASGTNSMYSLSLGSSNTKTTLDLGWAVPQGAYQVMPAGSSVCNSGPVTAVLDYIYSKTPANQLEAKVPWSSPHYSVNVSGSGNANEAFPPNDPFESIVDTLSATFTITPGGSA